MPAPNGKYKIASNENLPLHAEARIPVIIGALIGFLLGGVIGTATFGWHGGLVGCIMGTIAGIPIMLVFRSSWAHEEVKKPRAPDHADED